MGAAKSTIFANKDAALLEGYPEEQKGSGMVWECVFPAEEVMNSQKGEVLDRNICGLAQLKFPLSLRFFPKGVDGAAPGYCSAYLLTHADVVMQVKMTVNHQERMINPYDPVKFQGGQARGYMNFCSVIHDEVRVKVEVMDGDQPRQLSWLLPAHYEMGEQLGKGAYGTVHAAWDTVARRSVALKRIDLEDVDRGDDSERVYREVKLLRTLRHRCVVQIFGIFEGEPAPDESDSKEFFIAMERCDSDLKQVCSSPRGVSLWEARQLLHTLVLGCGFLHSKHVFHRDLKPANVLVDMRYWTSKICDFNLSRIAPKPDTALGENALPPAPTLTRKLTAHVFTRFYRAPEVCLRQPYDEMADVWSVGCIFAELCGALNTQGRTPCSTQLFLGEGSALSGGMVRIGDQLEKIIDMLGTPFDEPEFKVLPDPARFMLQRFSARPGAGLQSQIPPVAGDNALALLEQMLKFFPSQRITMKEALRHPFFVSLKRSSEESGFDDEDHLQDEESPITDSRDLRRRLSNVSVQFSAQAKAPQDMDIDSADTLEFEQRTFDDLPLFMDPFRLQ